MPALVARVSAKLGDTTLDVAHIASDGAYRVGTAAGVDLVIGVGSVTSFPIVTGEASGYVVRGPIGLATMFVESARHSAADPLTLLPGMVVTVQLGLVELAIELVDPAAPALPRPRIDRRPPAYVSVSLAVHLMCWAIAVGFAAPLPQPRRRPVHVAHPHAQLARLQPSASRPIPRAQRADSEGESTGGSARSAGSAVVAAATSRTHAVASSDAVGVLGPNTGEAIAALAAALDHIPEKLGQATLYNPDLDAPPGFGGGQRNFDPTQRAGWGTIAAPKQYATISSGHGAGDDYHLPDETVPQLALCESMRCEVTGAIAKDIVRRVIAQRTAALLGCVGDQSLVLDLEVSPAGRVTKIHGHGKRARCAANLIGALAFPAAATATHATFTIGYP